MALRGMFSAEQLRRKARFVGAVAVISLSTLDASALEIKAEISKVDESGKVELLLPEGAKVAIGDKVRIEVKMPGLEPTSIKTRWTVKSLDDGQIVASPDGTPTRLPNKGARAVINTIASQPVAKPEMQDADQTNPLELNSAEMRPAMSDEQAETTQTTAEMRETEAETTPPAVTADASDAQNEADTEKTSQTDQAEMTPASDASDEPNMAPEMASKMAESEGEAMPDEAEASTSQEAAKPAEQAAVSNEEEPAKEATLRPALPVADASDIHPCDELGAHPFDPDAIAKGVEYEKLDTAEVIAVCNDAIAQFPDEARFYSQLTRGLHKAGQLDKAFDATMKGAELGSAHSMAYLGVMYKLGDPVSKDLQQSLKWFEKAAENGNPGGMIFAAAMYRDGTGTPQDYKRAAELYQMAVKLNVAEAMTGLAIFHDRGQGTEKSPAQSARLLLKAMLGDDQEARKLLLEAPGAISQETRKSIQSQLQQRGYYTGKIDGDFGPQTTRSLKLFRKNGKID